MKNKIKFSIKRFISVAVINLLAFSFIYSFPSVNGKTKKDPVKKRVDLVKVADAPIDDSVVNNEEVLMKELMKKISQDYKTTNITIAIDEFDKENIALDKQEFVGKGEVKIGEIEWNTINFDVVLDKNKKPVQIKYEIK